MNNNGEERQKPLNMTDAVWSNAITHPDFEEVLFTEKQIIRRCAELGGYLSHEYDGKYPLFVSVMTGAVFFFADLMRYIVTPCQCDAVNASSYLGATTVGCDEVKVNKGAMKISVKDRHVVLVEDIIDTGRTAQKLIETMIQDGAKTVSLVCLLDKPSRRLETTNVKVDHIGFDVPDKFLVGYGLDYDGDYRNVPYIGVLKPELYR